MKNLMIAASLALVPAIACIAPGQGAPAAAQERADIRWEVSPAPGKTGAPDLKLSYEHGSSGMTLDSATVARRGEFAAARTELGGSGPADFRVTHEAGTLDCTGALSAAFSGSGRCSFTPDPAFRRGLADRGIPAQSQSELLAMLMVDATLELADGLTREGVRPEAADDLIAAAALEVTPAYVRDLKAAPMRLTSVDDAVACRALGVTGAYVRELAAAGYADLSSDDVVGMKALGVTGDYAKAMNRMAEARQ